MSVTSLEAFFNSGNPNKPEISLLPICHTTKEFLVFDLLSNKTFQSDPDCPHFKDSVFFFYGKAKYVPVKDAINGYKRYFPVTLIFELKEFAKNPSRMLPFDSGGFDRYNLEVKPIDLYVINSPSEDHIKRYIYTMYGSNANYLKRKFSVTVDEDGICFPLAELKWLHAHPSEDFGEQAYTVELSYDNKDLYWTDPKAIVVPLRLFTSKKKLKIIKEQVKKIKVLAYKTETSDDVIYSQYLAMQRAVQKYISKAV